MTFELRPLEPHTEAKHRLLRQYLGTWYPIMAKYNARVIYYDAFSGPGEYQGGEPGSPLIALDALVSHGHFSRMSGTEFHFALNEQSKDCVEHLTGQIEEYKKTHSPWPSSMRITISNSTFIDLTTEIIDDLDQRNARMAPTFAFVDPVGVKATPMAVLQRLTQFPKAELLVYFAHEAVTRFHGAGNIDQVLTDLYGTDEYKNAQALSTGDRGEFLHDLYKRQLHEVCQFPYIQSFSMYDHRGKRVYDLFYCTHEAIGLDRMKQAMWKVAPSGDFRFQDRFAHQEVIFGDAVDTAPLQRELLHFFADRSVTIQEVTDHVVVATPFASNHVKRETLAVMQRAGLITSPNQARANTYPDGTIISFPPQP